jgi:hypothetical protein
VLGTIITQSIEPVATPADRQRYKELLLKPKPSAKEVDELRSLIVLHKKTPVEVELDSFLLVEVPRLKKIADSEPELRKAEDKMQKADAVARKKLLDEEFNARWKREHNEFPEAQAYNAVRREIEVSMGTQRELATIYARFPTLFGFPADIRRSNNETYGPELMKKMGELGIEIFETFQSAIRKQQ